MVYILNTREMEQLGRKRKFSDEDYREWINLYKSGISVNMISKLYNCSKTPIKRILLEEGIYIQDNSKFHIYHEEWIRLYVEEGLSTCQIAKLYNCRSGTVLKILNSRGIEIRNLSEAHRRYPLDESYFDRLDSDDKLYFLGFLAADGNIDKCRNRIKLDIHRKDEIILNMFREKLKTELPITYRFNNNGTEVVWLVLTSKHMKETLVSYGIVPNKTFILEFPNAVPKEYYHSFIRGYFDGDGCIAVNRQGRLWWQITSASKPFIESIQNIMIDKLGLNKTLMYFNRNAWRLGWGGNRQVRKIYDWLYNGATVYLPRKKAIFEQVFGSEELQKGGEPQRASKIVI